MSEEEMMDEEGGGVTKKFLYVNRRAPYGSVYALESLEVVLIGAQRECPGPSRRFSRWDRGYPGLDPDSSHVTVWRSPSASERGVYPSSRSARSEVDGQSTTSGNTGF